MKYMKYLLPVVAAVCLLAYAANEPEPLKIKPKHPVAPPAAQNFPVPVPVSLSGAADGVPYGLHVVSVEEKSVTLQWNNPEPADGYFDDFEGHSDFVINSPGAIGWDYLDMDNADTYTWSAASFPNQGQKMAFIIMNPSKTVPSTADWPNIKPFSGNKLLVSFCASARNNDYLISPELNFTKDFQVSFQAKSYTGQYGLERIRVGYSTSGKRPSDFTFVSQSPYEEVPAEWTLKKYEIPKEARYVTLNCVSDDAFMLLIDDLFIGTNKVRPKVKSEEKQLTGFNLYRDGEKVNGSPVDKVIYTDEVPRFGDYRYTVSSVFSDQSESEQSELLEVKVPDTRLLPFEDDFSSWSLDPGKWNTPADEKGNENKWKVDYYTYGLVDPAATYAYSRLENYSQSLVTRELRTLDPGNTWLRFELRLLNYKGIDGDTLSVEVSTDRTNWKEVHAFCNGEQTFSWRVEQFDLKDQLDGQSLFQIRFRAHGTEAYYLDYWYVDDVKVWNPRWTSGRLNVSSRGTAIAGCSVTLTAGHGAVVHAVTDARGEIDLPQIEQGTYDVSIVKEGFNTFRETWEVDKESDNRFTAVLTQPVLRVTPGEIAAELKAEERTTRTLTFRNEGDGPLKWNTELLYDANSGDVTHRWEVQRSFDASGDLQSSVAFDGEHYYTASWFHLGKYFKYDKDGRFIEEFSIPRMYYKLYDLAFDGTYFYGSDNSNRLFQLDLRNKRLVNEIVINEEPDLKINHCCYDPRNDQFWVGGYNSLGRIDREGNVKVAFRPVSTETEMVVSGSAFDQTTLGGPYLWLSNQVSSGTNSVDKVQLVQYNLNTRKIVSTHSAMDVPGYKVGNAIVGSNFLSGLEATPNLEDGTLTLLGILQQSPSRIFAYKLCDVPTGISYSPKAGTLEAGAEQQLTVRVDALNGIPGESYTTALQIHSLPGTGPRQLNLGYTVTGASETPRPVKLAARTEGTSDVELTWERGATGNPSGYNLYRNGKKINETAITTTGYTDKNLVHGSYSYTVTAVYENRKESAFSEEVVTTIKFGAPYYAPTGLTSSVEQNQQVVLSWQLPDEKSKSPVSLRRDSGINEDALGMGAGGYFWAGALWEYEDLVDYRGMSLDEVTVFIKERCLALSLKIYRDDECIRTQVVRNPDIRYGEFNRVILDDPVRIEAGYSYKVTFLVMHDAGLQPLGMDGSVPVEGKGNLISTDGKVWFPATHIGISTGNFNISMHLSPASAAGEQAPAGYHIYRNGTRVTAAAVTARSYTDWVTRPGMYTYQVSSVFPGAGESGLSHAVPAEIIEIGTPVAPSLLKAEVELNRTVRLRWNYPLESGNSFPVDLTRLPVTCEENHPEFVNLFRGHVPGEMAVASDGTFIYTSVFKANGTINKYTLEGEFIESFDVNSNLSGIRNLAYDGTDFYASDCNSFIYKVDLKNKRLDDTLSISEIARHLTYIPDLDEGRGGFEVGDWETGIYVNRKGAKLGGANTYKGAAGTAYYKGTLYAFEQGYESSFTLCMYDYKTGEQKGRIDLKEYAEISPQAGASAGGMTVITTREGLHLLALALQEPSNTRFIFLDLDGVRGVEGYNVYANGEKLNETPLKFRYYEETRSLPGVYSYEIETVYVDGTTSARSKQAVVEIVESGECQAPVQVKARPSTYGYNVIVSFADPEAATARVYESAESGAAGSPFERDGWQNVTNGWVITGEDAYDGTWSLTVEQDKTAWLIIPAGDFTGSFAFSLVARNSDDHLGNGRLELLASAHTAQQEDFSYLATVTTTEAWKQYRWEIPSGTRFIAVRHTAGAVPSWVDAISLNEKPIDTIYGYDIWRDGKKLNDKPVSDISYTDHNLLPGTYRYQVKAFYTTSCITGFSETAVAEVNYPNNCQAPGRLSATQTGEGVRLDWSAPSLGDAVHLKWHRGAAYDAAGMPGGGCYFAGVQWTADELKQVGHLSLAEVEVYINQVPDALYVLVYQGNSLVGQQYVPELRQRSFNTIVLDRPVPVDAGKSLRVAVYVEHNEITVPLGYDEGPAVNGKGNLYSADGASWSTLADNQIYGNWSITIGLRAYARSALAAVAGSPENRTFVPKVPAGGRLCGVPLKEKAASTVNTFDGYNLYCNGEPLNDFPLSVTTYLDRQSHSGTYLEYQVAACYSGCGEVVSNTVRLLSTGIEENIAARGVYFHTDEAHILAEGVDPGMEIRLQDATGRVVYSARAESGGTYRISTAPLSAGLYLIRAGNFTGKVMVTR